MQAFCPNLSNKKTIKSIVEYLNKNFWITQEKEQTARQMYRDNRKPISPFNPVNPLSSL